MFPAQSILDELDSQAVSALENTPRIFILHKLSKSNIHWPSSRYNSQVDTTSTACVTFDNRSETISVKFLPSENLEASEMDLPS